MTQRIETNSSKLVPFFFSPFTMSSKKQPQKPKYGYLQLHDAYKAIKEKGFAVRKAARQHGLPESTLRWRLANLKGEDLKWGGQTIFSRNQEEMLAERCVSMAHLGYGFPDGKCLKWQRTCLRQLVGIVSH